jgi:hypothetical protein
LTAVSILVVRAEILSSMCVRFLSLGLWWFHALPLGWLRSFLSLANGIPSHDTFRRVFRLIDPDAFEACFSAWAQSCAEAFDREVVAIDGKTLRRSFDRGRAQGPLHRVSAWASEQGLALGQREVDGKSNEITAIPALLETLSLTNGIVTLDAMGCQKTIASRILERGADYLLVLKANHSKAFRAVKEWALFCPRRHGQAGVRRLRRPSWPPGAAARVRLPGGCRPEGAGHLVRAAHRAGGGNHPRGHRLWQGRGRDPLLPVKLP